MRSISLPLLDMDPILLCSPNFSEGRDQRVIQKIVKAIREVEGVHVFAVDRGESVNRTVVSFGGVPSAVFTAAKAGIEVALNSIDMRLHKGIHPRMGAVDVCPFIPYRGINLEQLRSEVEAFAQDIANTFQVPVYLYAQSARTPERARLPNIRKGGYEKLAEKLKDPRWKPDFGPIIPNTRSGAMAIGVRDFIAAFNVTLNTRSESIANKVAAAVRESGSGRKLTGVQAIGWFLSELGFAQVSLNVTKLRETPLHVVLEAVEEEARRLGVRVSGSEVIGLVPAWAMVESGRYYASLAGEPVERLSEEELIQIAIRSLMVTDFRPEERLPEWVFGPAETTSEILELSLREVIWGLADRQAKFAFDLLIPIQGALTLAAAARLSSGLPARSAFLHQDYMKLVEEVVSYIYQRPLSLDNLRALAKKIFRGYALLRQIVDMHSTISKPTLLLLTESFTGVVANVTAAMRYYEEEASDVKQEIHDLELQGRFFRDEILKKLKI